MAFIRHTPSKRPFDLRGYLRSTEAISTLPDVLGTYAGSQGTQTLQVAGIGGAVGSYAGSQTKQTLAVTGRESVLLSYIGSQAKQTLSVTAREGISGTIALSQGKQTLAVTGQESLVSVYAASQGKQTLAVTGRESVLLSAALSQGKQTISALGQESITGNVVTAQATQKLFATNAQVLSGTVTTAQGAQTIDVEASQQAAPIPAVPFDPYQRAEQQYFLYPFLEVPKQRERRQGIHTASQAPQTMQAQGSAVLHVRGAAVTVSAAQKATASGSKDTFAIDAQMLMEILILEEAA